MALAVAVESAGGGAHDLGLAMASSVLALLACSLFGGVWADRLQPKHVMVVSDLVRLLCAAGMAAMFAIGGYHLLPLCLLAAISAGAGSFFNPAMVALRPLLVPTDRRQSANATLSMLQTGSSVAGPALGGLVAAGVYHIANGVILVLVQVLAVQRLGGASAAGFIAAAEGLGGTIGAAVALRWRPRHLLRAGWLALLHCKIRCRTKRWGGSRPGTT